MPKFGDSFEIEFIVIALNENMRLLITLICLLFWTSASMANAFTFEIEHAGYEFGQSDKKGEIIKEFRAFPWIEEIERGNSLKRGVDPTLSVHNSNNSTTYWASMAGNKSEHGYLLGIIYDKQVKSLFGFGKPKTIQWLEIFLTQNQKIVEDTFSLFFSNEHEKLMASLRKLEKYGEMESKK